MRIVCLSDTHKLHDHVQVPGGDLLLHGGDFTGRGNRAEVQAFGEWLTELPHPHKVVIAGNHDFLFERKPAQARALLGDATYLQDSGVRVAGLEVWGSPWQPWFHDWAFNLRRGAALAEKWALIPASTDVLLTHGPPHGVLDTTFQGEQVGCEALTRALERVQPRLHVFGHIHEQRGAVESPGRLTLNACICSLAYRTEHAPFVVDWNGEHMRLVEPD